MIERPVSLRSVRSERQILETAALAHEIWREHYAPILSTGQIEYMLQHMQSPDAIRQQIAEGYEYFLIRSMGTSAGYIALVMNHPAPDMFLSKFYIRADMRGKGYGRAALQRIDELARQARQHAMWLTVNKGNPTIRAYEAFGFATDDEKVAQIGGGYVMDDYIMRRAVPKNP